VRPSICLASAVAFDRGAPQRRWSASGSANVRLRHGVLAATCFGFRRVPEEDEHDSARRFETQEPPGRHKQIALVQLRSRTSQRAWQEFPNRAARGAKCASTPGRGQ
jgi:hypothetical protein